MRFEPGNTYGLAGRPVGAKNKLSRAFREALIADAESTLEGAGYDHDPALADAVRERLFS